MAGGGLTSGGRYCVTYCTVSVWGVEMDENSYFAGVTCGAHVIFMHENVMERCGEKLANWQCRGHVWRQRG